MTFEDFMNKKAKPQEHNPEEVVANEIPSSLDEVPLVVVDTAPVEEIELIPMIPFEGEHKEVYNSLDMYKEIDPQFYQSVMNWD